MAEPFCKTEPPDAAAHAFVRAVKERDVQVLDALLTADATLRARIDEPWFEFDKPAIVFAARHLEVVDVLLAHGAEIDARSQWNAGGFGVLDGKDHALGEALIARGATVDVWAAAGLGKIDRLRALLDEDPNLVHAPGGDGQRPLHFAGSTEVVDLLLERGADLEMRDVDHGATAAQYAVGQDEAYGFAKCRDLIEKGAVVDLYMACALGDAALAAAVLDRAPGALSSRVGLCPHTDASEDGHIYSWRLRGAISPLEAARAFGHDALYDQLYERAGLVERFVAAAWEADRGRAEAIVAKNPGLLEQLSPKDRTLLCRAAWENRLETARLLHDLGFDPHATDHEDGTPLDRAAFHGLADMVRLLVARDPKPPVFAKNRYGADALGTCMYGAVHGWREDSDYPATVELLLQAGSRWRESWLPSGNDEVDAVLRAHPQFRVD